MMEKIKIFGYGLLINIESLKKTIPEVIAAFPAILEGYVRVFETTSTTKFTEDGIPVCVLNIEKSSNTRLNGVCLEITKEYFDNLLKREVAYELQKVIVKSFTTQKDFTAFVFIDKKNKKQDFLFDEPVQIDYLEICLNGAKDLGDDFYNMFLGNTLINGCKLKNVNKINHLL